MKTQLQQIIDKLRSEGIDYANFKALVSAIENSGNDISKDDISEFVATDARIQLHTTPNSIAKLISFLSQNNHPKSAIDICCGTGNILYYLQNEIDDLTGVEIIENIAELTRYFMPDLHVITADTFLYTFNRKYDLVVGNIPYGIRIELNGKKMSGEEGFIRKALELLEANGKAIMLVPQTLLFSDKYNSFRNELIGNLNEIISLPSGIIRNTLLKTSLLVFENKETKDVKLTQLEQFDYLDTEYKNSNHKVIDNDKLNKRWDTEYHLNKEVTFYNELDNIKTKELKDLSEIIKGKLIPSNNLSERGSYFYLKPVHIQKEGLKFEKALSYVTKETITEADFKYILQPGDIVISTIFNELKMYAYQSSDEPAIASNNLAIIRSSKQDYIFSYLQTEEGQRIFKTQAEGLRKGVSIPHLSIKDLANIKIPILPISDLNKIGDKSLEKASKNELQNQLEILKSIKFPSSINDNIWEVNEPFAIYNSGLNTNLDTFLSFLNNRFDKIEQQLRTVDNKLDKILTVLSELRSDFASIQKLPRDEDEKIFKLCQKIDTRIDRIIKLEQQTIEGYIEEVKRWLDLWELLDIQSQKFLPIAEFIFDELNNFKDADYSPFVVQYCRTLENEILKKLFESYHKKGIEGIDRSSLVKHDLGNKTTGKFATMVEKNKLNYTLGDMNFIMALLKQDGNNLKSSPLLQHFRNFVINYFDERIVEAEFLTDVNNITTKYRNKAAHPYSIDIQLAKECQILIRKSLNQFLESLKKFDR